MKSTDLKPPPLRHKLGYGIEVSLQVQQGGISVDKALVESLPSLTRALMERRFMYFVHTIFHFN